ncbi:putative ankyrin repeat protein RF_0381 isoform X2 [Patella vulgata]|uniref:putative ankyrin repeat protein RF_0381 isoform X2 n=1 Tax=Patella vulgata TaxID=6465 RepID=UPI0024A98CFC|nr:putative ankyrin repeat protein RF_0381 isoform X2 [Patella vulgata]
MSSYQVKQKGRMPEEHYRKSQANFCYLVDQIKEPVRLGNKLFEKNVFNLDEKDEIKKIYMTAEQGRWEAADKLVTYILNCGDVYGKFILCLRELGYREMVNLLENTTNDTRQQQQQQLFDACRHGTLDDIKNMVNIDVNVRDSWDQTPLFKCCMSRVSPVDKIKYLVSHQADIKARDSHNHTILHAACWCGTLSTVQYLVNDLHMNVNTTGWHNSTPLFYCCRSSVSPVDKIKYLVSHQADINARDSDNSTILHWACRFGTLSTVQYLVDDLHMNVNTTGRYNQTPLFNCCMSRVSPVDKIKYLVSHQADINARDSYNTILHVACLHGTLSTVQYLVDDLHMNVNTTGRYNQTPLFNCCMSRVSPVDKIKYLVSHQADINVRDSYNDTILHEACRFGTLSTVQYLVDCLHLDLHVKNNRSQTVLDYCRMSDTEQDEKIKYITDQMKLK